MEQDETTATATGAANTGADGRVLGQAGYVIVANATKQDWIRKEYHQYQMNSWDFPSRILAGHVAQVRVEWEEKIWDHVHDDGGEAGYQLADTGQHFQFQARWPKGGNRDIRVQFTSIDAVGHPLGSTMSLGWVENGEMNFILSGEPGRFNCTNPPPGLAWMTESRQIIAPRTLREIALPGSHDAGMSKLGSHTAGAFPCNTLTQSYLILGQLEYGARYFDIRPVISAGAYYTGHYSYIDSTLGWQGGNGQSIHDVISNVNSYLASHPELVILRFSHDVNTDVGEPKYRPFTQSEYDQLLGMLAGGLQHLYVSPGTADLTKVPIQQFTGAVHEKPRPAVLVVVDPDSPDVQIPQKYLDAGIYPVSAYPVEDHYTGTNDLGTMVHDQIQKMYKYRQSPDATVFVLSWTLTQNSQQAGACQTGLFKSIIALANEANQTIYGAMWGPINPITYPNVLYTDNVNQTLNLELALAINYNATP